MPGFEVIGEEERQAVDRIFTHGNGVLFAHGFEGLREKFYVREFEKAFAKKMGVKYALAVSSGSTALLVALKALGVGPGDEVITQAFTFVATVEAILMLGATPILIEVDDTYNMDPKDLKSKITSKTKAIIPVHMAGVAARMEEICQLAKEHGVAVLEDTAQGIGATYQKKMLGTIGDVGIYSLDFGKTVTCGEGGVVVTDDQALYQKCLEFHDHGHEYNASVGRAQDGCTTWGLNFRLNEMAAAVATVQLGKLDNMLAKAATVKQKIVQVLNDCCDELILRVLPAHSTENFDSVIFRFDSVDKAHSLLSVLTANKIATKNIPDALKWHFAEHWTHMFKKHPIYSAQLSSFWPNTRTILSCSIALPVMIAWSDEQLQDYLGKLEQSFSKYLAVY